MFHQDVRSDVSPAGFTEGVQPEHSRLLTANSADCSSLGGSRKENVLSLENEVSSR